MLWICYKLPSGLFGNTRNTSVMHEKANFVCFNYMQPQKVKFKSVQINMKHVSYAQIDTRLRMTQERPRVRMEKKTLFRSKYMGYVD